MNKSIDDKVKLLSELNDIDFGLKIIKDKKEIFYDGPIAFVLLLTLFYILELKEGMAASIIGYSLGYIHTRFFDRQYKIEDENYLKKRHEELQEQLKQYS